MTVKRAHTSKTNNLDNLNKARGILRGIVSRSRTCDPGNIIDAARRHFARQGIECDPMGAANEKTALPGTYRPVGRTCPTACRYHPTHYQGESSPCYATHGKVALAMQRAGEGVIPAAVAALTCMYARQAEIRHASQTMTPRAARRFVGSTRQGARLHVSGDMVDASGAVDRGYIESLCVAADMVREDFSMPPGHPVAYTYTHIPRERFELYRMILRSHGVYVTYSVDDPRDVQPDALGASAVVWRHSDIATLRARVGASVRVVACPAQTRQNWTCAACTLCGSGGGGVVVAFDPHGTAAGKA